MTEKRVLDKQTIGDRIKLLRDNAGWTQNELVAAAREYAPPDKVVNRESISMYENGHTYPDNWMVQAIARALNTSVKYLLGETNDPSPTGEPALTPEPVFWNAVKKLNAQPPHLQVLAARLIEAALEYAGEYGKWASSVETDTLVSRAKMAQELSQRAKELAQLLATPTPDG